MRQERRIEERTHAHLSREPQLYIQYVTLFQWHFLWRKVSPSLTHYIYAYTHPVCARKHTQQQPRASHTHTHTNPSVMHRQAQLGQSASGLMLQSDWSLLASNQIQEVLAWQWFMYHVGCWRGYYIILCNLERILILKRVGGTASACELMRQCPENT